MQQKYAPAAQEFVRDQAEDMLKIQQEIQKERIQGLERERHRLQSELAEVSARERDLRILLVNLLEGMKLHDVTAPGYEEAAAFLVQEQMLSRGTFVMAAGTGGAGGNGFVGIQYDKPKP